MLFSGPSVSRYLVGAAADYSIIHDHRLACDVFIAVTKKSLKRRTRTDVMSIDVYDMN